MYCGSASRRDFSVYDALEMMVRVPEGTPAFDSKSDHPKISLSKWDQKSETLRLLDYVDGLRSLISKCVDL